MPRAVRVVPSSGSTAMSTTGGLPSPISSPLKSIGASSFSPSPITTMPSIGTVSSISRIASTAAPSALSFSPRPTQRPAASAPASVTRTSSRARLRSGCDGSRTSWEMTWVSASATAERLSLDGFAINGGHKTPPSDNWRPLEGRRRPAPRAPAALNRPEPSGDEDRERCKHRQPVADREVHLEPVVRLVDDPVVGDQHECGQPDDRGELSARPGERVPPHHDPGEDERRRCRGEQQPAEDREGVPGRAAVVGHAAGPVLLIVPALDDVGVGREREPGEEQAEYEQRRGDHPDDLPAVEPAGVHSSLHAGDPIPTAPIGSRFMQRWGLTVPFTGIGLAEGAELVKRAEAAGYTDIWSGETNGPDGFTPLALASAWTERARLGTGVVGVMQRGRALLAQEAAALADASGGRFALGIGASSDRIVEGWNAMPFEKPLTRVSETIDFLRAALAGERAAGGFKLERAPEAKVPIIVAALRGKMLRLAVEKGDGAFTNFLPLQGLPMVVEQLEGAPDGFELLCRFFCIPGEREQVEPLARFMFSSYITVPVYEAFYRWLGYGERIDEMVEAWAAKDRQRAAEAAPWDLIEEMFIFGPPERMRERLQAFVDGGITLPVLTPITTPEGLGELIEALAPAP